MQVTSSAVVLDLVRSSPMLSSLLISLRWVIVIADKSLFEFRLALKPLALLNSQISTVTLSFIQYFGCLWVASSKVISPRIIPEKSWFISLMMSSSSFSEGSITFRFCSNFSPRKIYLVRFLKISGADATLDARCDKSIPTVFVFPSCCVSHPRLYSKCIVLDCLAILFKHKSFKFLLHSHTCRS